MTSESFANNRENFCYRHPDRQSFVLCQRCLRTICPECQTQAPVGVICPECMAEQRRAATPAQKKAQRRWGRSAPVALAASGGRPIVTYTIIALCAAVFVLSFGLPLTEWLGFSAFYLYPQFTGEFQPWRLLTASLVHSGFWHVGLNMLTLWMIGRILEPVLGSARFLTLYLISALGGSVLVDLIARDSFVVGASGAIFGLFGALMVIARRLGNDITGIIIVLAINLVIGFVPGFNISWQAHVGGLVAGAVVGLIYVMTRERRRRALRILLLIGWSAILIGLLALAPAIW